MISTPNSDFSLTLLLVGGGGESPPVVFLICTKNRLRYRHETWGLFVTIHWANCVKILTSLLAQRRLQGHFRGGTFRLTSSFPTFSTDQRAAEACNSY